MKLYREKSAKNHYPYYNDFRKIFLLVLVRCSHHLARMFLLPDLFVLKESYTRSLIFYVRRRLSPFSYYLGLKFDHRILKTLNYWSDRPFRHIDKELFSDIYFQLRYGRFFSHHHSLNFPDKAPPKKLVASH